MELLCKIEGEFSIFDFFMSIHFYRDFLYKHSFRNQPDPSLYSPFGIQRQPFTNGALRARVGSFRVCNQISIVFSYLVIFTCALLNRQTPCLWKILQGRKTHTQNFKMSSSRGLKVFCVQRLKFWNDKILPEKFSSAGASSLAECRTDTYNIKDISQIKIPWNWQKSWSLPKTATKSVVFTIIFLKFNQPRKKRTFFPH